MGPIVEIDGHKHWASIRVRPGCRGLIILLHEATIKQTKGQEIPLTWVQIATGKNP